jgi:hypothetical protein
MAVLLTFGWSSFGQSITQGASKTYTIKMNVGNATGATYQWSVTPANGTSTNLSGVTGNSATIKWDGPVGLYSVAVQVTDGNGCLSEAINQNMEILAPGDLIFAAALPNTQTCSDLAGGTEGSVPAHSQSSFRITYAGAANLNSANITVKNPAGLYVDLSGTALANQLNPQITVPNNAPDKAIDFNVADSWENSTGANVQYELVLVSAITSDLSTIVANAASDVKRTITVLPKPVIAFE